MGYKESLVEKYLLKKCKENDILCYKFESPANNGVPDRILIKNGSVFFIECKRENEKPTILQMITINEIKKHKVHALWINHRTQVDKLIYEIINNQNISDTNLQDLITK